MAHNSAEADGNADSAWRHHAGHVRLEERTAAAPPAFHKREVGCRHCTARWIRQKDWRSHTEQRYVGRRRRGRCQLVKVGKQRHVAMHRSVAVGERQVEAVYLSVTENALINERVQVL